MPNPCYPVILPPSLRPHVFRPIRRHTHMSTHHVPGRGAGAHHAGVGPSHSAAHPASVPRPAVAYDCVRTPGALPAGPGMAGNPVAAGSGIAAGAVSAAKAAAVAGLLGLAGAGAYGVAGGGFFGPGYGLGSGAPVAGMVQPGEAGPVIQLAGPGVLSASPGTGFPMMPGAGPEVGSPLGPITAGMPVGVLPGTPSGTPVGTPPAGPVPQAPAGETIPPSDIPEPGTIWVLLAALVMTVCVRPQRLPAG